MTRPEQFNIYAAQVFHTLYMGFPTRVDADELVLNTLKVERVTDGTRSVYSAYREKISGNYYPRQEVDYLCDCISWLLEEKYLCGNEQGVTLSSKGLNMLQRVPEHMESTHSYAQLIAGCLKSREPEQASSLVMDMFAHIPDDVSEHG